MERWMGHTVGQTGAQLKCFMQHPEGEYEKWEGSSWRMLAGCISFNASGSIVDAGLSAWKEFCGNLAAQGFISDFSFSPCSAGDGPE